MHFLKLSGLPISFFNSNINHHFVVSVTVGHIVQKTAASNRFEFGFHYVYFKSTAFDAIPDICKAFDFPIFVLNSTINLQRFNRYCKSFRSKNSRFKSFRVWVPLCLLQVDLIWCNPWNLQVVWFSYILFEFAYKSCFFWLRYCKAHRSTNSRFKQFRVCIPWCLLKVNLICCISWNWQVLSCSFFLNPN